jgi:hypothetical protein
MLRVRVVLKINCTQVLLKFHEYYVPVLELSLSTTYPCTQTQLIIKYSCTQLKYLSSHCNRGRSCSRSGLSSHQCSSELQSASSWRTHPLLGYRCFSWKINITAIFNQLTRDGHMSIQGGTTAQRSRVVPVVSSGSWLRTSCLLWVDKARAKDKTYIWVSVWWKTKN